MNARLRKLLGSWRVWLLIIVLLLSVIAIRPQFDTQGAVVRSVVKESPAALANIQSPLPTERPVDRERVLSVNGVEVEDADGFYAIMARTAPEDFLQIRTDRGTYLVPSRITTVNVTNGTRNSTQNVTVALGLSVADVPRSNIRLGLDLSGGTRVVLKPETKISQSDLDLVVAHITQRLNVYGLSDIIVRTARDLSGDDFIIVEIAGADRDEVQRLLASQGKFEGRIGNQTVFRGGQDITFVCRSPDCMGPQNGVCQAVEGGAQCMFAFAITLTPEAAQRQADVTRNLSVLGDLGGAHLSQPLDLYLDDDLVTSLQIAADLKGRAQTDIQITGAGSGPTQAAARVAAGESMKQLQTVLVTGSLPVKLEIVKTDGISPAIGSEFVKNALLLGLLSILAVTIVLVIRYRQPLISIPIVITMLSEITIVLGFAGLTGWNLDLAAIAAIVIAIGSGVDDQIVMIDETLNDKLGKERRRSWKERIGMAFLIVLLSYFTLAAAMIPLFFAGAGLLRGFAITTLVGITAGVLITRPAFAQFMEVLLKKDED